MRFNMTFANDLNQQQQPQHSEQKQPENVPSYHRFRRIFAQLLATTVKNMLLLDLGFNLAFPSIVIAALTGILNEHNRGETLHLTPLQASWLGSIGFIFEPLGCLLSAFMTDPLGRKRAMLLVNVPFIIGWFMLYNASSVTMVFVAISFLGLGVGLMESPIITFIGEICEPTVRGVMIAYSALSGTFGMFIVFTLNTLMPWRTVALVCMSVPILTIIALLFIPETPLWLLSKNRTADAERSLQWLRGWVPKAFVSHELKQLERYSERSKSCVNCIKQNKKCPHPLPTITEKLRELKRTNTLKPFCVTMMVFAISSFSGMQAMSPFIVQISKAYETPIAPDQTAAVLSFVNNLANVGFIILIRFTGKRPLFLTMLSGMLLTTAILCAYGFIWLPSGFNSFDQTQQFSLENKQLGYIPFVCIILWSGFTFFGVNSLGWQMMSEVFPYKTRGLASGLTAALNYVLNFIAIKSYYNLETLLSLPGVTLFNVIVIVVGLILAYNILPETEGRTLEDIEIHFSDKSKNMTNHKIPKRKKLSKIDQDLKEVSTHPVSINGLPSSMNGVAVKHSNESNGYDNGGFVDIKL